MSPHTTDCFVIASDPNCVASALSDEENPNGFGGGTGVDASTANAAAMNALHGKGFSGGHIDFSKCSWD